MESVEPVMAYHEWPSNADLIVDCARLGYLREDWLTCDPTFGKGTFWKKWKPDCLVTGDLKLGAKQVLDATDLPFPDRVFDSVVIDGPYKLNGTPDPEIDARYGTDQPTHWKDRIALLSGMLCEGERVLKDGFLLFKCQDQVCSGKVRWQTRVFTDLADALGLGLVDRLDMLSYRAQPEGTSQVHARRNASQMLVFKRGHVS